MVLEALVDLVVSHEGAVAGMLEREIVPVVEQRVPRLKEPREDIELENGDEASAGELDGRAQLGRLQVRMNRVHLIELDLELAPRHNHAVAEVVLPEIRSV